MAGICIVKEESRDNSHGYTNIKWQCLGCGKFMNLPEQQNFRYCFHCGRKVVQKIGGKEVKEEEV